MQYKRYRLVECTDYSLLYGVILLNEKHNIKDFQQAIYDVKEQLYEKGVHDWTIEDVFCNEKFNAFDYRYIKINEDEDKTIEI